MDNETTVSQFPSSKYSSPGVWSWCLMHAMSPCCSSSNWAVAPLCDVQAVNASAANTNTISFFIVPSSLLTGQRTRGQTDSDEHHQRRRAQRREVREPAEADQARAEAVPQRDQEQAGRGQRRRHAQAVREHQHHAEPRAAQRDRAQQDDQRGRRRHQAARDSHSDEPRPAVPMTMTVAVSMTVPMTMTVAVSMTVPMTMSVAVPLPATGTHRRAEQHPSDHRDQ